MAEQMKELIFCGDDQSALTAREKSLISDYYLMSINKEVAYRPACINFALGESDVHIRHFMSVFFARLLQLDVDDFVNAMKYPNPALDMKLYENCKKNGMYIPGDMHEKLISDKEYCQFMGRIAIDYATQEHRDSIGFEPIDEDTSISPPYNVPLDENQHIMLLSLHHRDLPDGRHKYVDFSGVRRMSSGNWFSADGAQVVTSRDSATGALISDILRGENNQEIRVLNHGPIQFPARIPIEEFPDYECHYRYINPSEESLPVVARTLLGYSKITNLTV